MSVLPVAARETNEGDRRIAMLAIKMRKMVRSRRGQTLVLGSLGVLLVSIMMMLTLNVGQSVHEKIKLQQYADAAAFSTAVQEARVYNYLAYTNRANIGALVSASSLHGFQSMASSIPEMFEAAGYTFFMHAGIEFAMCLTCCWPFCFSMCKHCLHGIKDLDAAFNYLDDADDYRDAVKNVDSWFTKVITALDLHMIFISGTQKALMLQVAQQIQSDKITKGIRDKLYEGVPDNKKPSINAGALRFMNMGQGGLVDIPGKPRGFSDVFSWTKKLQQAVPTMIANGTRWSGLNSMHEWFVSDRGLLEAYLFTHPKALMRLMYKDGKPAKGLTLIINHEGQGRTIKGADDPKSKITKGDFVPDGNASGAYDSGMVLSMGFICIFSMIPMVMTYEAWVSSAKSGGKHKDSGSCTGESKHKFRCLDLSAGPFACFTVFKPNSSASANFGQPTTYSVVSRDLSMMNNGEHGAWEVDNGTDKKGNITVDLNTGETLNVQLSDNISEMGKGWAMSKAMAYYHFPRYKNNGWKEHPNLFNPYWKAKLHPFRSTGLSGINMGMAEPALVLGAGGASNFIGPAMTPGVPLP